MDTNDDFYYLYNPGVERYLKYSGVVAESEVRQALLVYIKKVGANYTMAYINSSSNLSYISISSSSIGFGNSSVSNFCKLTIDTIKVGDVLRCRFSTTVNGTPTYLEGTTSGLKRATTINNNCYWELKTPAEFKGTATTTWTEDNYFNMAASVADKKLYYLYNPAIKMFIGENKARQSNSKLTTVT